MPNLDFYALGDDFNLVLDFVFNRAGCRVFESYSAIGQDLREFKSTADLVEKLQVGTCKSDADKAYLQLLIPSASSLYHIEKIQIGSQYSDDLSFRYAIKGWGLIQLYLGGLGPNGIIPSHTNHFSPARAGAWEDVHPENSASKNWNWAEVKSISSSLNRFIKKISSGKMVSRPVLPAAHTAFVKGGLPADVLGKSLLQNYLDKKSV
jgi:hypothetical protein